MAIDGEQVRKGRIYRLLLVVALLTTCAGFYAREAGYQYYFAKGLTLEETVSRFGEPLWTHGHKDTNDLSLYYQTGILNTAALKIDKGRVSEVSLYIQD
jgi:hypothetical protein